MKIQLEYVQYMPKVLDVGILYVSKEFGTAAHLCACGCGAKIRTPLGPAEWSVEETKSGPTLRPSVGNWQQPCRSHYVVWRGEVHWKGQWTENQITVGRIYEQEKMKAYCDYQNQKQDLFSSELVMLVKRLFSRK